MLVGAGLLETMPHPHQTQLMLQGLHLSYVLMKESGQNPKETWCPLLPNLLRQLLRLSLSTKTHNYKHFPTAESYISLHLHRCGDNNIKQ